MTDVAVIGLTATLTMDDGASNAFVAFLNPVQITVNQGEVSNFPTHYMGQTGNVKTRAPGMIEPGSWEVTSIFNPTDYARIVAITGAPALVKHWKVTLPDTGTGAKVLTAPGFVNKISDIDLEDEKRVDFKFSIMLTDKVVVS